MSTPNDIEEQIKEYLLKKLAELRAVAPGEIILTARTYQSDTLPARVAWEGYCSETGWELSGVSADDVISIIAAKARKLPSLVEKLREQAAQLMEKADELEAKSAPTSKANIETFHQEAA
ncbi:hypothetical protein GCM10023213_14230 [Prosthecobacter algae]|uniref:Uncharacterized protein n=1 Tax=Prosthecobacter algae TaxID=1144682 RepID=A0ABP9P1X5_9BACT